MDLVRTIMLYMMMLVGTSTSVSPEVTPLPASALPTPTPYVTQAPTSVPTARPTASPRPTRYSTLYVGDKGTAVRSLQTRLKELGYLKGNVDGSYGAQTKTAVENFQRANGLKVDGIAGRNTQQVLFESADVIYANAATPTPTLAPVTAAPVAPAIVTVRYLDVSTGTLIRQTTAQCYADTNIYADAGMVPATYRLVSNSFVSIRVSNGQASPSTVTFYYQPGVTATPNTGVSVPVYYLDATNLIIARETRTLYQSAALTADTSLIPKDYTLSGSAVVYVTVNGNSASPNPVIFRLNRNQATPAPTATPLIGVTVQVRYINQLTGQTFNTQNVTLYQSNSLFPLRSLVPEGYTLVSASSVSVTVSNGRANPSVVDFVYLPYQPTATPIVGVQVPVTYVNAASNRTVYTDRVMLTTSGLVYADMSKVPGYTLASASSVYVKVSGGQASPATVTFRVNQTATPTPAVSQVSVPVRYLYGTRLVGSQTVTLPTGRTSTVYADATVYDGNKYTLTSTSTARVTVTVAGVASPSVVTFYVAPKVTPTPSPTAVPVYLVNVPVRYVYGAQVIDTRTVQIRNGATENVYADTSVYGADYVLISANPVRVSVSAAGVASPAVVTFYLERRATPTPAPTAVPVYDVPVTVRYMVGSQMLTSYQEMCTTGTTTTVYADASVYQGRYTLQGSDRVNVTVDYAGVASPSVVTFYLIPIATATPTAAPVSDVSVPVRYMYNDRLVGGYQELCPANTTTVIYADPSVYGDYYVLTSADRVSVYVDAAGHASPAEVIFYLDMAVTPMPVITPVPAREVPVDIQYWSGNDLVYSTSLLFPAGRDTVVSADPEVYASSYTLAGGEFVTVSVSESGLASPNPVIFLLTPAPTPIPEWLPTETPVPVITPEPVITPVPTQAPPTYDTQQELPAYVNGYFSKSHAVYQGPGTDYYRSNSGKASYGSGGSARIYGTDGEWLLIGYQLGSGDYRIGYIRDYTLPEKVDPSRVRPLSYAWIETTVAEESVVTDDPVINMKQLEKLSPGTPVTFLAWASDKHRWALIEYQSSSLGRVRAFVKGNNLACMK